MSEFCEHETFKDICGICHRDTQITALRSENERLLAANRDSMMHFDVLKADYERLRAALEMFACDCEGKAICLGNCARRNARALVSPAVREGK